MKKIYAIILLLVISLAGVAHAETMPVNFLDELKKERSEKEDTLKKVMAQGQQMQQKMSELQQQALVLRGAIAQADETIKKLETKPDAKKEDGKKNPDKK